MTKFDKIFKVIGVLLSYLLLTEIGTKCLLYTFNNKIEWLLDCFFFSMGACGILIGWYMLINWGKTK